MRLPLRLSLLALAVAAAVAGALLYRTLQLGRDDAQAVHLEPVNPAGEILGPEGIDLDGAGRLYVGDHRGVAWSGVPGGRLHVHAGLAGVVDARAGTVRVTAIASDASGGLYVGAVAAGGGTLSYVPAGGGTPRRITSGLGSVGALALAADGRQLWLSDRRESGRVLRYRVGNPGDAVPEREVSGLAYPAGLALGAGDRTLYVVEARSGTLVRMPSDGAAPRAERILDLRGSLAVGSLEGLGFDPRDRQRRFLYVAENLRGLFTVVDVAAAPPRVVKRLGLAQMGGRPCPAALVIRDGYLYFADRWSCSPVRILLGMPELRTHAYRFRVADLTQLY